MMTKRGQFGSDACFHEYTFWYFGVMIISGFIRVDVAYVFIFDEKNQSVLMVQNEDSWSLPGGKREDGETLREAAVREAKEETGLEVVVHEIVHVSEKFIGPHHALFVTFRAEIVGGNIQTEDAEIQQVEWKPIHVAQKLMPYYSDLRALLRNSAHYQTE
jgi:8-oxo-dGTP diphosphatase